MAGDWNDLTRMTGGLSVRGGAGEDGGDGDSDRGEFRASTAGSAARRGPGIRDGVSCAVEET